MIQKFQYKLFNDVLYRNQKLFQFGIVSCSKFSFCDIQDKTPLNLFYECVYVQNIWNQLRLYLAEKIDLTVLTPQGAVFGSPTFKIKTISCLIIYFKYSSTKYTTQHSIIIYIPKLIMTILIKREKSQKYGN